MQSNENERNGGQGTAQNPRATRPPYHLIDRRIKLTIEQAAYAFEQIDAGVSQHALALELGISQGQLSRRLRTCEREGFAAFVYGRAKKKLKWC